MCLNIVLFNNTLITNTDPVAVVVGTEYIVVVVVAVGLFSNLLMPSGVQYTPMANTGQAGN